ncbi:DNA polymerase III subunit alpha [Acidocella sp. KAb 2-4]|uniref:DNA polymerase III subunit alpha n=1 Tax=Acidocella sp. KAb 2-4 TaxID=2885158 RepID=UPI001D099976|nr:DNA polymerase III subunit alpha [Acidocella sp. KAb 2-4]MCB5944456.1 DNA polymerase III subunit alpha [Acidocella sp. KAb 2-4]
MPHADFVHLRVHSAFSLSEGAIKPDKIAALARDDAMPAVAIADTSNMFGALEFSQYCTGAGVQPIIGCQLGLKREGHNLPPDHVVLLAQNEAGYANLQRLSSVSFLDGDGVKPQISREALLAHAEGLFLLTGGVQGPIGRLLAEGQMEEAASYLAVLAEAFAGRIAVELQRHGEALEAAVEPGFLQLAERFALPIVATNECFFAKPEMYEAHDALLCIAEGRVLAEKDRRRVTPEHWFKPARLMRELFADLPDACDNTLAIAQSCAVMAQSRKPLLPTCPKVRDGATETETLRAMAEEGLRARLAFEGISGEAEKEYWERLEFELGIIIQMGFPGYFLIVSDFIQWAKDHRIPVGPGRGSGAGSLVAWALRITDLNPLRYALLFERFLNPERVSMPDFDIDFCQERRDEVISYVTREYGAERVAQIITFGKLQARAAVRDVGRVLGLPYGQVNKVAELIPNNPAKPVTLREAIDGEIKLRELRDSDEGLARLMEIAMQIEGLYRHASTHAAGVVIGDRPLVELVPLYKDPRSDLLVTQYSMKYVEQAGLVKFDFLGLTTLTIIDRALSFLRQQGVDLDISKIPLDDKKTYEMIGRGDTAGVFTFETAGYRAALQQMRPDRFEDLVAIQALNRPGPMANIPDYCARKRGEPWEAPDPAIHHILAETYGIIVYQEQVMQIAQVMAGYTLAGADLLRRAMGKKIRAEMDKQREIFCEGAAKQGFTAQKANEIFDLMAKFADYGFNKSHAAAYALVSYQTAYLRANHPVAFLAACMSLAITNTDKLAVLRGDAMRSGIKVLPPDVNKSGADFMPEMLEDGGYGIRYALGAIKRVGVGAMEELARARGDRPFRDLSDFSSRIDAKTLTRAQIEILAKAGAFDMLERNRARVFAAAETIMRAAHAGAEERSSGQIGLFGGGEPEPIRLPEMPDWPELERLANEAEAIGFHVSAHPLDMYAQALKRLDVVPSGAIQRRAEAGACRIKLAGTLGAKKERITRTGSRMMWATLSDMQGSFEVTLFSEVLNRSRELLEDGAALLVTADVKMEGESLRITASDVSLLDKAAAEAGAGMKIWLDRTEALGPIKSLLEREGRGKGRVVLAPKTGVEQRLDIRLPGGFNVSPRLAQAMKLVPGVELVEDV